MPNFPYLPLQGRRIRGFDLLASYLWPTQKEKMGPIEAAINESLGPAPATTTPTAATSAAAEFMIFLGDFIYADVPFYYGDDKEAYRRLYRRNYASDSFRKVYERLRECFMWISIWLLLTPHSHISYLR